MINTLYGLILAGGKGERLWPLSRLNKPKQFLEIEPGITLLEQSIQRLVPIIEKKQIKIVATPDLKEQLAGLVPAIEVIVEPAAKNTGPALLWACLQLAQEDPEGIMVVCPADHAIGDTAVFQQAIITGIECAKRTQGLVLLGIQPTHPATGYGYIQPLRTADVGAGASRVERFHEKPDSIKAAEYLKNGYLWNSGIFIGSIRAFLQAFETHAPEITALTQEASKAPHTYCQLPSISFDHAVLEHEANLSVIPLTCSWSDLGNLESFLSAVKTQNRSRAIEIKSQHNLISCPQMAVLIGVEGLCIVQTEDVLVIAKREQVEEVKQVVQYLHNVGHDHYL